MGLFRVLFFAPPIDSGLTLTVSFMLDVGHFLEHGHKFRQVIKLGKPRFAAVTRALRGELNSTQFIGTTKLRIRSKKIGECYIEFVALLFQDFYNEYYLSFFNLK